VTAAFDDAPSATTPQRRFGPKRVVVLLALLAATALAFGRCAIPGETLEDGEGLAGTYVLNGIDPLEGEYAGTVRITALGDDEYAIAWIIEGFPEGVGRLDGDTFVVEWSIDEPRRLTGVAEYELRADGSLVGTRTVDGVDGDDGVLSEEIFPDP
jgi:hypothetical protein